MIPRARRRCPGPADPGPPEYHHHEDVWDYHSTIARQTAIAFVDAGTSLPSAQLIWAYLNRIYGIPEVDNTEHLPDLVTTHAAAIAGRTNFSVERLLRLEKLTTRALHHTTGGFHTHPLWDSLERRLYDEYHPGSERGAGRRGLGT